MGQKKPYYKSVFGLKGRTRLGAETRKIGKKNPINTAPSVILACLTGILKTLVVEPI